MADSKKHFYAVLKGRKVGIYPRWSGAGGAEELVKGFAGAVFRGFATRQEAELYLRSGGKSPPVAPVLLRVPAGNTTPPHASPAFADPAYDYQPDLAEGRVVVYTDGASTGNPGPGGYGVVLLFADGGNVSRRELSGGFRCTTNNRMELFGVITALRALKRQSRVALYSDSRYVVNAVEKGWAKRWRARGWMRDGTHRAENADLWEQLLDLLEAHQVEFRWVKGHASSPENERCDRLAVQASQGKNLPHDTGYQGACD